MIGTEERKQEPVYLIDGLRAVTNQRIVCTVQGWQRLLQLDLRCDEAHRRATSC
jgi:hypothetical protein